MPPGLATMRVLPMRSRVLRSVLTRGAASVCCRNAHKAPDESVLGDGTGTTEGRLRVLDSGSGARIVDPTGENEGAACQNRTDDLLITSDFGCPSGLAALHDSGHAKLNMASLEASIRRLQTTK